MAKVLILTRRYPFPANTGENQRISNLVTRLSNEHQITILFRNEKKKYQNHLINSHIFYKSISFNIGFEPNLITKIFRVIKCLFLNKPIMFSPFYFLIIQNKLNKLIKTNQYDYFIIEHSFLSVYLNKIIQNNKDIKTIISMHNIEYVRFQYLLKKNIICKFYYYYLKNNELHEVKKFDIIICMSNNDKNILKENPNLLDKDIVIIPNGSNLQKYYNNYNKRNILFIGLLNYGPNLLGLNWFIKSIFPNLDKKYCLYIVGKNPPDSLKNISDSRIKVLGYVEDLETIYANTFFSIVPLMSGSGTRLKILESCSYGVPVVSTSKGAEGIDYVDNYDLLLFKDANDFGNAVEKLENPKLYTKISQNAYNLIKNKYSWDTIYKQFREIFIS